MKMEYEITTGVSIKEILDYETIIENGLLRTLERNQRNFKV